MISTKITSGDVAVYKNPLSLDGFCTYSLVGPTLDQQLHVFAVDIKV